MQTNNESNEPQIPDWLHNNVIRWSADIVTFLNNLTGTNDSRFGVQKAAMPSSAFKGVKALAFVFRRKWAFLGTYQRDVGFVTRKLTGPEGVYWSPPYFIYASSFGAGLSFGALRSGMCLALMNEEAVKSCIQGRTRVSVIGQFLIDMDGARIRKTQLDSTDVTDNVIQDPATGAMIAKYFRMEAMLLDFSIGGGVSRPWKSRNICFYGNATPEEVLESKVKTPSEFVGVLDVLKRHAREAAKPKMTATRSRSGKDGNQFVLDTKLKTALSSSGRTVTESMV